MNAEPILDEDPEGEQKICSCCRELLPVENFVFRSKSDPRRRARCRDCDSAAYHARERAKKREIFRALVSWRPPRPA